MVIDLLSVVPGLREAVELETISRDTAFLGINESINGFEVLPMTLRHYVTLRSIGSPVLNGEIPDPIQLFTFLWILSPSFKPIDCDEKKQLLRKIRKLDIHNIALTITEARKYISETFLDAKSSSKKGETYYYSDACALCDMFGSEYGWSMEATMSLKMKCVFQFVKAIKSRHGEKMLSNPSDILKSRYLDELNQKARNQ